MHILHMADTHLGYSAYYKTAENGLNQREVDVYDAFRRCIDYAIESEPDLVVHGGDLFDTVRPTNRALNVALQQLIRLSKAGIPLVLISGNHETPKLRETGSVFRVFEHLDNVYPVYRGQYEQYRFDDVAVHCIPHCSTGDALRDNLVQFTPVDGCFNLFMLHVGVSGIKEFRTGDFNEQVVPTGSLPLEADYIALGHYHRQTKVTDNAWYAGSVEHLSFSEAGEDKGMLEVDTDTGEVRSIPVETRPMIDADVIDCSSRDANEITREVIDTLHGSIERGCIIRVVLRGISRPEYRSLDFHAIREAASEALHFDLSYDMAEAEQELIKQGRLGSLAEEWKQYMANVAVEDDKEELRDLALSYLAEVSE